MSEAGWPGAGQGDQASTWPPALTLGSLQLRLSSWSSGEAGSMVPKLALPSNGPRSYPYLNGPWQQVGFDIGVHRARGWWLEALETENECREACGLSHPRNSAFILTFARWAVQCRVLLSASKRSVNSRVPRAAKVASGRHGHPTPALTHPTWHSATCLASPTVARTPHPVWGASPHCFPYSLLSSESPSASGLGCSWDAEWMAGASIACEPGTRSTGSRKG